MQRDGSPHEIASASAPSPPVLSCRWWQNCWKLLELILFAGLHGGFFPFLLKRLISSDSWLFDGPTPNWQLHHPRINNEVLGVNNQLLADRNANQSLMMVMRHTLTRMSQSPSGGYEDAISTVISLHRLGHLPKHYSIRGENNEYSRTVTCTASCMALSAAF
jgi:hypothetical protein